MIDLATYLTYLAVVKASKIIPYRAFYQTSMKSAISHSAGWHGTFDRLLEYLLNNGLYHASASGSFR